MCHITAKLLLAADAGGTKTDFRLMDRDGNTIAETKVEGVASLFPGTTPVKEILQRGIAQLNQPTEAISHCYFSLGGPNTEEIEQALARLLPQANITVDREANGNMMLAVAKLFGCESAIMIGTGSVAVGKSQENLRFAGGWGPTLDDAGSGGNLGLNALRTVLKAIDRRTDAGHLSSLFPQLFLNLDLSDFNQRMELKHRASEMSRKDLASVVPQLFNLARQGDAVAQRLIRQTTQEIGELAAAVTAPPPDTMPILACGGMFQADPDFRKRCLEELQKRRPNCQMVFLDNHGMIGCAAAKLLMDLKIYDSDTILKQVGKKHESSH